MVEKHKNIYLFLSLACFLGIVLIFLFDGYMGIYDSLEVDNGQYVQTIDTEQWREQDRYGFHPSFSVERDRSAEFTCKIENHRFSSYVAEINISLWYGAEKVTDLSSGKITAAAFGEDDFVLVFDPSRYVPADFPTERSYEMTVVINRGDVERRVMVYVNPGPPKPVIPAPSG